ncbi:MAG: type I DNA topoisomerase [Massiliimalia sp.]|jgi:DNA topoisomerase-1
MAMEKAEPKEKTAEAKTTKKTSASATKKKTAAKTTKGKSGAKKTASNKKLVIVESPAKAKTIKKYLGRGYEVVASMGHIRDLPKSQLGVDVENDFEPKYINIRTQSKTIKALKEEAKGCKSVFLATDPDREGEAISWHLAQLLGLDMDASNRVTFNEITQTGIKNGMAAPRQLDMDLINAQQTRRILDRLVGYKLSPFLWKKIRSGLSAGRVQSVVVSIIVDRENEIRAFVPQEYWTIEANLASQTDLTLPESKRSFVAKFYGKDGKKIDLENQEQADAVLKALEGAVYQVSYIKQGTRKKSPAPPFITSTLQQEASRKLGFQSRRTMQAAQELYEGVDVEGYGTMGLITYMRTDSLRLSDEARAAAKEYITGAYGERYLPESPRVYKTKGNVQDGHEAIRPTTPSITPAMAKDSLTADQYKIYKLVWERFIASQMANCVLNTVQASIDAADYVFKASGYSVQFDGYTVLYEEGKDEETQDTGMLPPLTEQEILKLLKVQGSQHFTQPPARFTEASLIKTLEENGIGRPSTYSPTITTVIARNYIEREGRQLVPTTLGEVTTDLMKKHFPEFVEVDFTANMETDLDKIEEGKEYWKDTLRNFYKGFSKELEEAEKNIGDEKIVLPDEVTDEVCEFCGRNMVVKTGRFGKFLACPGYPECKNTKKLVTDTGGFCPLCGGKIVEKKSKKGKKFYGCDNYPECTYMTWDVPTKEKCPKCGKTLLKKAGRSGKIYCSNEQCDYERTEETK